jgi:hypothetical protein
MSDQAVPVNPVDAHALTDDLQIQLWLDDQEIRQFMRAYGNNAVLMALTCMLMVWSLAPYVASLGLLIWGVCMSVLCWDRHARSRRFLQKAPLWTHEQRMREGKKAQTIALLASVAWASLVLIYYGRVPPTIEAFALTVYVGVSAWSLIAMAPHWRNHKLYVLFLGFAVIAGVIWSNIAYLQSSPSMGRDDWMLVGLICLCMAMFHYGSRSAYDSTRASPPLGC